MSGLWGEVDNDGWLILSPDIAAKYGLDPGTRVVLEPQMQGRRLRRPVSQPAKVYIEPFSRCNLNCRMCIRNMWKRYQHHSINWR